MACVGIIYAATTIGTNISTGGTLNVSGASTLTGNTNIAGALTSSGANTFYGATSIGGALTATSTLAVNGATTLYGALTGYGNTTLSNLTATGTLSVTGLTTIGNASTTQLSVSSNAYLATTTISGDLTASGAVQPTLKLEGERYPQAMVTFTIDDGWDDNLDFETVFASKGINATAYIVKNVIGSSGYMTTANIQTLIASGWEIGSHGVDHTNLTTLNEAQIITQLSESKSYLEGLGATVTSLAYPYAQANVLVRKVAKDYYNNARKLYGSGYFVKYPLDTYGLASVEIILLDAAGLQAAKDEVDAAYAQKQWLIFTDHLLTAGTDTTNLGLLIDYIQAKSSPSMPIVTIAEGMALLKNTVELKNDTAGSFAVGVDGSVEFSGVMYKTDNADETSEPVQYRFLHNFSPYNTATTYSSYNTFIGRNSGNTTMTGTNGVSANDNTGIGYTTLTALTTGSKNVAIGTGAGQNISTGYTNSLIGMLAGTSITAGYNNTAMGAYALNSYVGASSAGNHTAFGYNALKLTTSANTSSAFGTLALAKNTEGGLNVGMGYGALYENIIGDYNTGLGYAAGFGVAGTGDNNFNTFIGAKAGYGVTTTANNNVLIGFNAGDSLTTGDYNVIVGGCVDGYTLSTHTGNVMLGYCAGAGAGPTNKLFIDNSSATYPLIKGDFTDGSEAVTINGKFVFGSSTTGAPITTTLTTTALAITSNVVYLDCDGGTPYALTTITGGINGMILIIKFTDACTVTDNDTAASNTIDINETFQTFVAKDTLQLLYDGTSWYEVGHSDNTP